MTNHQSNTLRSMTIAKMPKDIDIIEY